MNIAGRFNHIASRVKIAMLNEEAAKEVRTLYEDVKYNTSYNNVKIKLRDRNRISVIGKENKENTLSIDINLQTKEQNQTEHRKGFVFSLANNHREFIEEIRGNIDGTIKRIRTTNIERNKDNTRYVKTIDYQNLISGNSFRREETPDGVKFFRNIDGDFVEMFPNKK